MAFFLPPSPLYIPPFFPIYYRAGSIISPGDRIPDATNKWHPIKFPGAFIGAESTRAGLMFLLYDVFGLHGNGRNATPSRIIQVGCFA